MKIKMIGAAMLALPLMACGPEKDEKPEDTCGATALQSLVGQPKSQLETMRFSQTVRIIGPGQPITRDYRIDRLNIEYDEKEMISRLWCG